MTAQLQALLAALGGLALACALAFALGIATGDRLAANAAAAQALKTAQQQARLLEAARQEGVKAVAELRNTQQALQQYQTTVDQRITHARLIAPAAASHCTARRAADPASVLALGAAGSGALVAGGSRTAGSLAPGEGAAGSRLHLPGAAAAADGPGGQGPVAQHATPAPAGEQPVDDDADARLSLASVSLWNSALAGRDMPAGACRADDLASAACAADAGVWLTDAWRNHAQNAASCAADRAQHRSLIEYLRRTRPSATASSTP